MKSKFTLYTIIAPHSENYINSKILLCLILLTLAIPQLFAQPIVLDLENNALNFINSNRSVIVDRGNGGLSQGSVHRYDDMISKNGMTVYGLLTIKEISNAAILNFDDDVTFGLPGRFQPAIGVLTDTIGYVVYQLNFYKTSTDEDVFLYNYSITGIDLDGNNSLNREFAEHGGYSSYTVNNPGKLEVTNNYLTGRTRLLGRSGILPGMGFDNSSSYIIRYANPQNSIFFALGQTGSNSERDYSLQFGPAGGNFTNSILTLNPLLVATDDVGAPVNKNTGGNAVSNVLSNDLLNGIPVSPSHVTISLVTPATNAGVSLNTTTGAVTVTPGTPAGTYTLKYQICLLAIPYGRCGIATVTVKVLEADLSISKTDSPDPVIAGQDVTYTIAVTNNGPSRAKNVLVTDKLPSALSLVRVTPTVGSWNGTEWNIGEMADSTTETLVLVAKVSNSFTGIIQNDATVTCSTYDPVTFNNSISQKTTVTGSANLSITKTESPDPVIAGQNITYTITVTNRGPGDALNVAVVDTLPLGLVVVDTDCSTGSWSTPRWNIGTLKSGASATMSLVAAIGADFTGTVTSKATVSSSTFDPVLGNNKVTRVTPIDGSADLTISEISIADTLIAGEVVNFSIEVSNNGPSDAYSIQLYDKIPSEIQFVQFSVDEGLTWNSWGSSYTISSLSADDSVVILFVGSLNADAEFGSSILNSVNVFSTTPDPDILNNNKSKTVKIATRSDMLVELTAPSTIIAGTKITYTLSFTNNGPSYASSLVLADTLPPGISNAEYSLNGGASWEVWHGKLNVPLFNYPRTNILLLRGDVSSDTNGDLINTAVISSSTVDPNLDNNVSNTTTAVVGEADLILSMIETISPIQKSGQVGYTIFILNNGPGDASNVIITDNFNQANISNIVYFNGSSWIPWTGSLNIGTLKNDSSAVIDFSGTITSNSSDPVENTSTVVSSTTDLDPTNNSQTIRTPLGKEADLSLVINGPATVRAGEKIQYSLTVKNHSQSVNAENVIISDILDDTKIFNLEYSIDGGYNWILWSGRLKLDMIYSGGIFTFNIRGDVYSNAFGTLKSNVQLCSNMPDPVTNNNYSTITTTITSLSDVSVVETVFTSNENIIEGSSVKFLITYKNSGPSDANDFIINDYPLVGINDFEVSQNSSAFLPWNGSLNIGNLNAGGTGSFILKGTITGENLGTISNTSTVESNSIDPNAANNSSQVSVSVNKKADLTIAITSLSNPIIAGESFTYTLIVTNEGPSNAQDVDVSTIIPLGLLNTQYSTNGGLNWKNWAEPYHLGSLASNSSASILIKSNVRSDLANGSLLSLSSAVESSVDDPKPDNNSCQITTTVQTHADLAIEKFANDLIQSVGDLVKFTLKVTNFGPSKASSVLVTDIIPSGFSYVSDNGNGAYNPATGIWSIGGMVKSSSAQLEISARVLSTGDYANRADVDGVDEDPNYLNNRSFAEIKPESEAIYSTSAPQNVDSYYNGQFLANVTDPDGAIVSALLSTGILPLGTMLDAVTGNIFVTDSTLLNAGNYNLTLATKDVNGGLTESTVEIILNRDSESVYNVSLPKNRDNYAIGETLAAVSDADGKIVDFRLISGSLPSGTSLSRETGEIAVTNTALILPGRYYLSVSTTDADGGRTTQGVTIEFSTDNESLYVVAESKLIENYVDGDTLAFVADSDGEIVYTELVARVLPDGSELNPITGEILIVDSGRLVAGTYWVRINTIDEVGGMTSQLVMIIIKNGIGPDYSVESSWNIDAYQNGDTLAFIENYSDEIFSAKLVSGEIPPGTSLDAITGAIVVVDSSLLEAGSYSPTIKINDIFSRNVALVIEPDFESIYAIETPQNLFTYSNGDILATVTDSNGQVVSAIIQFGAIPAGIALNPLTGELFVADATALVASIYTFYIKTTDDTGGTTIQPVTISFVATDLSITKTCSPGTVVAGEKLFYTLTVKNHGPNNALGVKVTDLLPSGLTIISSSPSVGVWESPVWTIGSLVNGGTETLIIEAVLSSNISGIITNTASLSSLTSDPVTGNNIAIQNSTVISHSNLIYNLSASPNPVSAGDNITYTMTVVNNGPSDARNVVVSDYLPANVTFVSASDGGALKNNQVEWNLAGLQSGGSHTLLLVLKTNSNLTEGYVIANISSVISENSDGIIYSNVVETMIRTQSNLSIQKIASSEIVTAGENITYTITATNNGPSDAANVRITDELSASVTFISASNGGTFNNGIVSWIPGKLVEGENYTCSLVVKVNGNVSNGTIIPNSAIINSNTSDVPVESNLVNVKIEAHSELEITKTASSKVVVAGSEMSFIINVHNAGKSDATNVRITDALPSSLIFVSASNGGVFSDGVVTWLPGKLIGEANYSCSVVVKVKSDVSEGTIINNTAVVNSYALNEPVESIPADIVVDAHSELEISKTASSEVVIAGENITYSISVSNNGPSDATNVQITDELPSSLTFVSATGNAAFSEGVVTWLPGKMASGVNYLYSLVVRVNSNMSNGTVVTNKAIVNSDSSDEPVESEAAVVLVKTETKLEIVKSASEKVVIAGNEVSYSINIRNAGSSDANNVTVTDTLPLGVTFVSASDGTFASGVVTWHESKLSGNSEKTYSLTVSVDKNVLNGTVINNTAFIKSDNSGGWLGSEPEFITVNATSNLKIQKFAVANVVAGENITYSIQLTNNGPSDAHQVLITDVLPESVNFVSASDGGTISNGVVRWNLASLYSGATQLFTLEVNVKEDIQDEAQVSNIASVVCDNSEKPVESNEVITTVSTLSIVANDDEGVSVVGTDGGVVVENVLSNDFFRSTVVDASFVDVSLVTSSPNVSLDLQTGKVTVSGGTPAGKYEIIYRICLDDYPRICDDAAVSIIVLAPEIKANDDFGGVNNTDGGVAVEDVTANDLLNGWPVENQDVVITLVTPAPVSGINLNSETGELYVEPGTVPGEYEIKYRICETLNPANCDEAVATITVHLTADCEFLIPTAFSPNDDGIHDYFMIKCIDNYPDAVLEVFNRWGNLVYKKEKYGNLDQWGETDAWWGGYSNRNLNLGKEKLPPGTYFYILKLNSGEEAPVSGSVFLNR